MQKRRRLTDRRGFTLVELLAATVLLGIVAGSMYACFVSAIRLHRRAADFQQLEQTIGRITGTLSDDLSNLVNGGPLLTLEDTLGFAFQTYRSEEISPGEDGRVRARVKYIVGGDSTVYMLMRTSESTGGAVDTLVFYLPKTYAIRIDVRGTGPKRPESPERTEGSVAEISPDCVDVRIFRYRDNSGDSLMVFERAFGV